jgi:N4-(beta-N-acetylglucosaminyl)-L-asparaginase
MNRRTFITASVGIASSITAAGTVLSRSSGRPVILSTWDHGRPANAMALRTLAEGGSILDAVERGVMVVESDPTNLSVGLGGLPDRDGIVTLDACVMTGDGRAGSVCFVQGIDHPVSVARHVMEHTPHVMLVGAGAERYARENGFVQRPNTLTDAARKAWEAWCVEKKYRPVINIENHDTIGLIGLDGKGRMAGACTTSGLAYKIHGRVGDSPIIGAGLYVDDEVGGATCTGLGEAVLRTLASFLAVERMRAGDTPQAACAAAIERIVRRHPSVKEFQVGILALDRHGNVGARGIHPGFTYAENDVVRTASSHFPD